MDAVSDPTIDRVVVMSSAQVGKTLILKAIIGYHIDQDPAPILVLQPTLEMAETFSKDRLAPMLRDVVCLRGRVADPRARDSGNTILHKRFPGGHLTIVGANSAAGLASRPIRIVLGDEVDRYPASAGTEGDPISLADKRTATFWNRKLILTSTPTIKGHSRIETAWGDSDQRRYMVKCPSCGHRQSLVWANVSWVENDPESARYGCAGCGDAWGDRERIDAIKAGVWIAEHPERKIAGFHLNEMYSPWRRLSEIVASFLEAKRSPEQLKTWVNTSLGETWEDKEGESSDWVGIASRREGYDLSELPDGVLVITVGIDVQDDRIELEFVGWGLGEESWGIDYVRLDGDPGREDLWSRVTNHLGRRFVRADGATLSVAAAGLDTGGHYTKQAYEFVRRHAGKVYALKGAAGQGRPLVKKSTSKVGIKASLYIFGADTGKELLILSRLRTEQPGPGYCHFPRSYTDSWFIQLTSERAVTRHKFGQPIRQWVAKGRNEALDCRLYAMAALAIYAPAWSRLAAGQPQNAPQRTAVRRMISSGVQT